MAIVRKIRIKGSRDKKGSRIRGVEVSRVKKQHLINITFLEFNDRDY